MDKYGKKGAHFAGFESLSFSIVQKYSSYVYAKGEESI